MHGLATTNGDRRIFIQIRLFMEFFMNLVFCNFYNEYNKNNYMFEHPNALIGDDLLKPMQEIKLYANKKGIAVATVDIMDIKNADAVVFMEMPDKNNVYFKTALQLGKPLFLILFECEVIRKKNYEIENHKYFNKVFTYCDNFIDNKKYFKINFSQTFPSYIPKDIAKKENLCTIIAGNKRSSHPLELYSKRVEAIEWFEKHHPEDFDLYGIGWDEYIFSGPRPIRALNRIKFLKKMFASFSPYPSYKGRIEVKRKVLERYKFSICYENAREIPGYITEKIFDCFFAGCVPVYWGADNIMDHIPKECFIDKRDFDSYEKLYEFIRNMDDKTYLMYIDNIQSYIGSPKSYEFTAECFAKTIVDEIING